MGVLGTALGALATGMSAARIAKDKAAYESSGLAYPSAKNMSQKYVAGVDGRTAKGGSSFGSISSSSSGLSTPLTSAAEQMDKYFAKLSSISASNNAWSAQQAQKQMDFQRQSALEAMKFNSDEAEKSRLWQERMSNTAHQREIKDLQAAGLNPVLSAMHEKA